MPKEGLSDAEWKKRLAQYAEGRFDFGRGQAPPKGSRWAQCKAKIDCCPALKAKKDLFGKDVVCSCGFHMPSHHAPSIASPDSSSSRPSTSDSSHQPSTIPAPSVTPLPQPVSVAKLSRFASITTRPSEGSEPPDKEGPLVSSPDCPSVLRKVALPEPSSTGRVPLGWQSTMGPADRAWIGKTLFIKKGVLTSKLKTWWSPPALPSVAGPGQPNPDGYFLRRLFLWMPRRMWNIDMLCPRCVSPSQSLRSKGLYHKVRLVLDLTDFYYLAAEYMDCNRCGGTYIAWDNRMLSQLPDGVRVRFPALLTYKYACDRAVIALLRARTAGNSPTALQHNIQELHSDAWQQKAIMYLSDCEHHRSGKTGLMLPSSSYEEMKPMADVPSYKWFLAAYVRDVLSRLDAIKAAATSTYGAVLKIDSTKKVTRKLQGAAANTANWTTSIGNERGEIVQCVLTSSEGNASLQAMADGVVQRFERASEPPPVLIYTDRDCCNQGTGQSKLNQLFSAWPDLVVRLDIWHFMRRLATACTSESHPLYGHFMSSLSFAIFEWDPDDVHNLRQAKRSQMTLSGIANPSNEAVFKAVTKTEMATHCKRRTRGAQATALHIEQLIHSLWDATDTLGVPLFTGFIGEVWSEQKRHISCLQDPDDIPLYTRTGWMTKGSVKLPVYRCSRGTTSLESFHLHLNRFIPGSAANALNYQVYLLEGIVRWNSGRAEAAIETSTKPMRSFDITLMNRIETLSQSVLGKSVHSNFVKPASYTGELIGVDYLFAQTGLGLATEAADIDKTIDDGFEDANEEDDIPTTPDDPTVTLPEESPTPEMPAVLEDVEDTAVEHTDSAGIPGWDKVDQLADALIALQGLSVSSADARKIRELYDSLLDYDKAALQFNPRFGNEKGRFKRTKLSGHQGATAVARSFLTGGQPACSPSHTRLTEAICIKLCDMTTSPKKSSGPGAPYLSRWKLVVIRYNNIRHMVLHSCLYDETRIQLVPINEATLSKWQKHKSRIEEVKSLLQGIKGPAASTCSAEPLIASQELPKVPLKRSHPEVELVDAEFRARPVPIQPRTASPATMPMPILLPTPSSQHDVPSTSSTQISRTTAWRRRQEAAKLGAPAPKKQKVSYTCKICEKPPTKETGHSQYFGKTYCPLNPNETRDQWLEARRRERADRDGKDKNK